ATVFVVGAVVAAAPASFHARYALPTARISAGGGLASTRLAAARLSSATRASPRSSITGIGVSTGSTGRTMTIASAVTPRASAAITIGASRAICARAEGEAAIDVAVYSAHR